MNLVDKVARVIASQFSGSIFENNEFYCYLSCKEFRLLVQNSGDKIIISSSPEARQHRIRGFVVPETRLSKDKIESYSDARLLTYIRTAVNRIAVNAKLDYYSYSEWLKNVNKSAILTADTVKALGVVRTTNKQRWYFGKNDNSFTVSEDTVYFELKGINKDNAVKIKDFIESLE